MNNRTQVIKLAILILAVIGLLSVLGFGSWGVVRMTKSLPASTGALSRLASLISGVTLTRERVDEEPNSRVFADPRTVVSGAMFTLEWQPPENGAIGIYELEYACGIAKLSLPAGGEIRCNVPFNLWSKESMKLVATASGTAPVELPIAINFIAQGSNAPTNIGSASLTVSPREETPKAASAAPKSPTPTAGKEKISAKLAGDIVPSTGSAANLAIQIVDTGIINDATGVFSHATSASANQRVGIVFDVMNIGGASSQQWRFRASLPAAGGDYSSDTQDSIPAGAKIRYTIGFKDLAKNGENIASITVDPSQQISDADRANNTATTTIIRSY